MSASNFEDRLYPGGYSEVGFLLPDQKLSEVIAADEEIVRKHGITLHQVGCVLERFVRKHDQGDLEVDGKYRIVPGLSTCGYQECPFEDLDTVPCTYGRSTIVVEKISTQERFAFESLVAHLVKEHNFCEGPDTPYRLDLEGAIRFFEISPDVDYTPKLETKLKWRSNYSSNQAEDYTQFKALALAEFSCKYFQAYLFPWEFNSSMQFNFDLPLIETIEKALFQEAMSLADFKSKIWSSRPKKTPEELAEETRNKVNQIAARMDQYREGRILKGLNLVLIAKREDFPENGLQVTLKDKNTVRFQIPALNLDVVETYLTAPSTHKYQLKEVTRYI